MLSGEGQPSESAPDVITPGVTVPPGVIVAGMHRSGTSMVTSVLVACGWQTHGSLLPADPGNRRGYFEDGRIHNLHKNLLESYQTTWDDGPRLRELRTSSLSLAPYEQTVNNVVAAFRANGPWIWNNPRATLFLEAWSERFPEAQFVICVRSPGAVVDSVWRRGSRLGIKAAMPFYRSRRTARGLSLWHSYNLMAYRFARSHPDRVAIVRIPRDLDRLVAATPTPFVDPSLMEHKARLRLRLFSVLAVRSHLLYWRLCRLHDARRLDEVLSGPGTPATPSHRDAAVLDPAT